MNREKMSPLDEVALAIIQNVGCISFHQIATIMQQLNERYNPRVTESFLHRLEACRDVKISPDGLYVTDGVYGTSKLDRKVIMAISVAMRYIDDPNDYTTLYRGYGGADLKFYANGTNFGVVINDGTDLAKVAFMEEKYTDFKKRVEKIKLHDKSDIMDTVQTLLIAYPAQATSGSEAKMQKCVAQIKALDLKMPHGICFLKDKDIFNVLDVIGSEPVEAR